MLVEKFEWLCENFVMMLFVMIVWMLLCVMFVFVVVFVIVMLVVLCISSDDYDIVVIGVLIGGIYVLS